MTVMAPTPDTAPRANGLAKSGAIAGRIAGNRLRSQKLDHGATRRMSPASRK
jgi:predicted NAD/FAD-dependent oxidoreductase